MKKKKEMQSVTVEILVEKEIIEVFKNITHREAVNRKWYEIEDMLFYDSIFRSNVDAEEKANTVSNAIVKKKEVKDAQGVFDVLMVLHLARVGRPVMAALKWSKLNTEAQNQVYGIFVHGVH